MDWTWKKFNDLEREELYQIIRARESVFVLEQRISYVDCDELDQKAWHLLACENGKIKAYLRAFAPGVKFSEASLGRVLTMKEFRNQGLGKALIAQGLKLMEETFGPGPIRISAQSYLKNFYQQFGFQVEGEEYLEEGLPHFKMLRRE